MTRRKIKRLTITKEMRKAVVLNTPHIKEHFINSKMELEWFVNIFQSELEEYIRAELEKLEQKET
jgi:hypothetical protein